VADRLDADRIAEGVLPALRSQLRRVTVLEEVDSTNTELARRAPAEQHAHVLLAERQTAGRGRGARRWHSPAGGNVYLSLGWRFRGLGTEASALPLAVAVAVSESLAAAGVQGAGIKWPNDILVDGCKLAGILVESQARGASDTVVITGIGINVRMGSTGTDRANAAIDRPWVDLESCLPARLRPVDRNRLVSGLLDRLLAAFGRFEQSGFASFRPRYEALDLLEGRALSLECETGEIRGTGRGVDDLGRLLITMADGEVRAFHSGEARLHRE
jgi:BirA family biotin operon repressor/biotin-[acetyl-CoA-carboxylase] ligase